MGSAAAAATVVVVAAEAEQQKQDHDPPPVIADAAADPVIPIVAHIHYLRNLELMRFIAAHSMVFRPGENVQPALYLVVHFGADPYIVGFCRNSSKENRRKKLRPGEFSAMMSAVHIW